MAEQQYTPGCAPSVLILFINMMLFGKNEPQEGCKEFMFEAQSMIQTVFVIIAVVCIPWMLLGKPLYIKFTRGKSHVSHVSIFYVRIDNQMSYIQCL